MPKSPLSHCGRRSPLGFTRTSSPKLSNSSLSEVPPPIASDELSMPRSCVDLARLRCGHHLSYVLMRTDSGPKLTQTVGGVGLPLKSFLIFSKSVQPSRMSALLGDHGSPGSLDRPGLVAGLPLVHWPTQEPTVVRAKPTLPPFSTCGFSWVDARCSPPRPGRLGVRASQ